MPGHDLSLLVDAIQAAGKVAVEHAERGVDAWDKPGDQGPVTEADLAVNQLLKERLLSARPSYGWLSEESEDNPHRLTRRKVFIVDPLDGTRSFIEGARTWAHSLAIAEDGVITTAAVFLPLLSKLYTAEAGQGAQLNGTQIRVSMRDGLEGASVLAAKPNYAPTNWKNGDVPDVTRAYRPSLAYRMSLVADGSHDAMMTTRDSWEWDIAAGDLITREAGGRVSDKHGRDLRFNNPHPKVKGVVAANTEVHDAITRRLSFSLA